MARKRTVAENTDILSAPGASFEAAPAAYQEQPIPPQSEWTVNGLRVSDMHPQLASAVTWRITDQFLQQAADRPGPRPMVEMIRNPEDKRLQKFSDEWDGVDPMKEIVDHYRQPGMRYRFLSPNHRHGKRKWELTKDPKTGDTPKYNGMMLAEMPEGRAVARQRFYEAKAAENLTNAVEKHKLDQDKAIRDSRSGRDSSSLPDGDLLTSSDDPNRSASIGVRVTRGSGADAASLI